MSGKPPEPSTQDAEIAALRAELAAARAELAAERSEDPAERLTRHAAGRLAEGLSRRPAPRWRETDTGAWVCHVGERVTRGEERLSELAWPSGWLLATGLEIVDRQRTREVDALVISPGGVAVIEQKDTAARGRLEFRPNGPALVDGVELPALSGALRQARLPAQMLSTLLREHQVRAGYVVALLTVHGRVTLRRDHVGGVHVTHTSDAARAAHELLEVRDPEEALPAGTVLALLSAVSLPLSGLPPLTELGFPDSAW